MIIKELKVLSFSMQILIVCLLFFITFEHLSLIWRCLKILIYHFLRVTCIYAILKRNMFLSSCQVFRTFVSSIRHFTFRNKVCSNYTVLLNLNLITNISDLKCKNWDIVRFGTSLLKGMQTLRISSFSVCWSEKYSCTVRQRLFPEKEKWEVINMLKKNFTSLLILLVFYISL